MNPGFDSPRQPDFRRQILYECLSCHTGYPEIKLGADAMGQEPLFPGRIPEGIDCQRCHGPGRAHIAAATASGKSEGIRAAIVNPKRLSTERQLEICMQCHLETTSARLPHTILRFDRGAFSYRPGTPLADFALHFDHQPGTGHDDKFEIAHQAYRLRKSVCFQKSSGRMTCTTCHAPHSAARGNLAVERYTAVCRGCHAQLQQLVASSRHPAESNCLECHMPKRRPEDVVNVVMTDHYIQRRPKRMDLQVVLPERQETETNRYQGPVVLYYPAPSQLRPEDELYVAVAQVKQSNNLREGIPRLAAALKQFTNAPAEVHFERAEAYARTGQINEAIRSYRTTIERKSDFQPAWLGLGRSLLKAGRHQEALEALTKAAGVGEENPTILNDLALGYLASGRTADAVRVLRQAVAVDPDHPEALDNLGTTLRESGDLAGAEQAYRSALRVQPDFAYARQHLADLLVSRNNFTDAEYHYQKAISQEPKSASIHAGYATALASTERYDEALEQFQAAALLDPNSAASHLGVADMLALKSQLARAIGEYQKALSLEPELGAAHLGLGSALVAQGKRKEAILHLQKAAQSSDANAAQAAREGLRSLN